MEKLTSVLKNVPLPLMDKIRKYKTLNSIYEVTWKCREPKKGEKYGYGGSLRRDQAKSADMYVSTRTYDMKQRRIMEEGYRNLTDGLKAELKNALDCVEVTAAELTKCQQDNQVCRNIIKQLCLLL